jgi:tRNA pseudouridine38-40 synthase
MNLKLIIAYIGTRYLGWQKTREGLSIEEELEKALFQISKEKISLQAASRTDAGVHAKGQVVNFFAAKLFFKDAVNALLPEDISVLDVSRASMDFHPTLDARSKEYVYEICNTSVQSPFHRKFSWHFPFPLDLAVMQKCAHHLIGTHDFAAFGNERQGGERSVFRIEILPLENKRVRIVIHGNRFLYKMVRNIVGTLAYIGCGKIPREKLPFILGSHDREQAGMTAPAHGLSLYRVFYDF